MCFSVCIYMVGNVIFLVGHLHWCPCFFTRGVLRGSMLYVLSFLLRAASSVPVGCWPLYFLSWRIFCVACYCWRRLGGEKVRILMTSFKQESQKDLLITLKRLVWLKHPVQKLQPLSLHSLIPCHTERWLQWFANCYLKRDDYWAFINFLDIVFTINNLYRRQQPMQKKILTFSLKLLKVRRIVHFSEGPHQLCKNHGSFSGCMLRLWNFAVPP